MLTLLSLRLFCGTRGHPSSRERVALFKVILLWGKIFGLTLVSLRKHLDKKFRFWFCQRYTDAYFCGWKAQFVYYYDMRMQINPKIRWLENFLAPNFTFSQETHTFKLKTLPQDHRERVAPKLPIIDESNRSARLDYLGWVIYVKN